MTNGDRIRTLSNEHLALVLMCPIEAGIAEIGDFDCAKNGHGEHNCLKCALDWLNKEEATLD